jgi:hypothetical protein
MSSSSGVISCFFTGHDTSPRRAEQDADRETD